jgi:hypothetical protein
LFSGKGMRFGIYRDQCLTLRLGYHAPCGPIWEDIAPERKPSRRKYTKKTRVGHDDMATMVDFP